MKLKFAKKTILVTLFGLLLILSGVICFIINNPRIRGHFYTGDRITINLKVISNGHEIALNDLVVTGVYNDKNLDVTSENGVYKTSGGNHGEYNFQLIIPKERINEYENDITLQLNYINANNWYISNSDCIVELDLNENGLISAEYSVYVLYNDNSSSEYKRNVEPNNNIINIYWGL